MVFFERILNIFKKCIKYMLSILYGFYKSEKPYLVVFSGGMGNQILSAAVYFWLKENNNIVYADLSYFEKRSYRAKEGVTGDMSHWGWQLNHFELFQHSFKRVERGRAWKFILINDGTEKLWLADKALQSEFIRKIFSVDNKSKIVRENKKNSYLCVHVRRGDYMNVATYMVPDSDFIEIANKMSQVVDRIIVVSDSVISEGFKAEIGNLFLHKSFLDNIDEFDAHLIMRNANILICSNSQFSS
jgi:hypothetical protein